VVTPAPPPTKAPVASADGRWQGTYHCTPSRGGGSFTIRFHVTITGGVGVWNRPAANTSTTGNQSLTVRVTRDLAQIERVYSPLNQQGVFSTATMTARFDGQTITGSSPEANSGGRTCDVNMTRQQ
jgi:hypothetical protein